MIWPLADAVTLLCEAMDRARREAAAKTVAKWLQQEERND